ncbi:hypothetical protein [Desertivirga brevis]|uniref:hypothetical protein n=1 Tax=Desertivirga brevis TaxID=2810310 RepID=UPI001A968CFF|nr:hypothetical protein [Pedobacter sp. SYSU D00873]
MKILNLWDKLRKAIAPSSKRKYSHSVIIPDIGLLFFNQEGSRYYWSGQVHNIAAEYDIELRIFSSGLSGPSAEQLSEVVELARQYQGLKSILLFQLKQYLRQKGQDVSLEELEAVFFWSSVELSEDFRWTIVLEPAYKANSDFDFMPQFQLYRNSVIGTQFGDQ